MLDAAIAQGLGFFPDRTQHLMDTLQAEVARKRLPGAVVLIARRGQVVLHEPVGWQNPQDPTPMGLDAIFRIYSMTKPVVSVAILMLLERGQLMLGDPVAKYLPEFANLRVANHVEGHAVLQPLKSIPTVHDLLRHTAGFTYEILGADAVQRQYAQARLASRSRTNREFAQALAVLPLAFEPATVWEYSRATDVLGALLEVVTGQSLGTFLQDNIFAPLGMLDTGFYVPPERHHRIAEPFDKDPDGGLTMKLIDIRQQPLLESAGGGLASTAGDYARFLQCLLNLGALDGARLLAPSTVRYMVSDHLGAIGVHRAGRSRELLAPGHGFGLGVAVRMEEGVADNPGSRGMYFWGGIAGTTFFVDPAKDFFAILMTQAPNQRDYYRPLFRNLVYAALQD